MLSSPIDNRAHHHPHCKEPHMAFPPGKTAPPFGAKPKKGGKEEPKGNPFAKGAKPTFPPKKGK
jgi:hypothetical protein